MSSILWCCEVDPVFLPDTDRWTLSMWEVNTAGCWVIIWCCSHFYYSHSVFLLGLTNNSQRFFAFAADGRFNCHPLLVYESSYGSILVSSLLIQLEKSLVRTRPGQEGETGRSEPHRTHFSLFRPILLKLLHSMVSVQYGDCISTSLYWCVWCKL